MTLSIAELKTKERKHRYYLENKEKIKKKSKEYYATKVKPRRQIKAILPQTPFSALFTDFFIDRNPKK